jgi:hypothetical protein
MIDLLPLLLRVAGVGLVLLALLHIPIGNELRWREEAARLSPANEAVFHVHTLFICIVLVMMALPCVADPQVFLERSRAGAWLAWSFAGFWAVRLYCQWFVYGAALWRGKRRETILHWVFTFTWLALTTLFAVCGCWQVEWLDLY